MKSSSVSRRSFLQSASLIAAAAPLSGFLSSSCKKTESTTEAPQESAKQVAKEPAKLTLRLSSTQANDPKFANGRVTYDLLLKHLKANKLDEQITVQFFPDNQLGQEIDVVNSVKLGVIDMMVAGTSIYANLISAFGVLDLCYLFQDFAHQTRAVDAGVGAAMEDMLLKGANTRVIGWEQNFGARSILSKTPFKDPAGLAGKKIRTLPNPVITEGVKLMGAAATPMSFGEIYTALQAGVLDGMEHDPPTVVASKFYEAAKNYTLTQHLHSPLVLVLSDATYQKMPPALRDGLLASAKAAAAEQRAYGVGIAKEALEVLKQRGVTVADCDREAFHKRVLPLHEKFTKQHPEVQSILDKIQATRA
jgi:tripartite ATP-independent transporter DctP family solute receptor